MNKTVFITGATSGIGHAAALALGDLKMNLILCGRRQERLNLLKKELSHVKVHTLCFDVADKSNVDKAVASLPNEFKQIDVLINNAGNAHGLDCFQEAAVADWEAMLDSNVKGLLYVSKPIVAGMVKRKSGQIINVGSIAGKEVYPKGNVYCATKYAVDALTKGMRIDLNPYGIRVAAVHPGAVHTEFSEVRFKGDQKRAAGVYEGYQPLMASDVADTIAFMVTRPAHVNVADVLILPTAQADTHTLNRE